jgi:hypothetical protein
MQISSGLTPCPSRPPKKPPYSKQLGNTTLHGMSPYESLHAHVHDLEPMVVSDDDSTDDLNHYDNDLNDASYEMDPFNTDTPVDNIQSVASKFTPCLGMSEKYICTAEILGSSSLLVKISKKSVVKPILQLK